VKSKQKKNSAPQIGRVLEDILGCKWTVIVLQKLGGGTNRPGALVNSTPGLTTKVLNQRLRKLLRFSVINKRTFAEIPPRVEYSLTPLGRRICKVLLELERIEADFPRT